MVFFLIGRLFLGTTATFFTFALIYFDAGATAAAVEFLGTTGYGALATFGCC
jgi:hypothetical protein